MPDPTSKGQPHRAHLDGIRAVAVVLVILFHLGYTWMPGGFVGVDVFFVLSGYLITGLLVDELLRRGRVDLVRFYARRVRRLLPAAALVVGVVLVGALVLFDMADRASAGDDATASALYVANWHFGSLEGDYFEPGDVPSPLVHFWSLAVEEQFYVVWPALLLGVWWLGRRFGRQTGVLLATVVALGVVSAVLSLVLEPGPLTYYGTHTRAYELLAGAALAVLIRHRGWTPGAADAGRALRATGVAVSVVALAALGLLAHQIPDAQDYPGTWGLGVVAASIALIAAVDLMGAHPARRLLGSRPLAFLGRLSYSLYLWHWPTIVFLPLLAARWKIGWLDDKPALIATMSLLALASYALFEHPIRFRLAVRARARRVVASGLALSIGLAGVSFSSLAPSGFETRALAAVQDLARDDCPYFARDWGDADTAEPCVLREGSGRTVALVGDSHAQQWAPGLVKLAERLDLKIISTVRSGCPANDWDIGRTVDQTGLLGTGSQCSDWRHAVLPKLVADHDPDVVFVATRSHVHGGKGGDLEPNSPEHIEAWSKSWDWTLDALGKGGARVVVSEILPTLPRTVPVCLAEAGKPTTKCDNPADVDRDVVPYNEVIRGLPERGKRIGVLDPLPIACPNGICAALDGDIIVHRDSNHLSARFAAAHGVEFGQALRKAGARLEP